MWDFDNDGRMDVYLGGSPYPDNWGWLFHQTGDLQFEWVTGLSGFHPPCPNGLIIADFDRDGAEDAITGTQGCMGIDPPRRTLLPEHDGRAEQLDLDSSGRRGAGGRTRAPSAPRPGDGGGRDADPRDPQLVRPGEPRARAGGHFGLGATCAIDRVEVEWPDAAGSVETFTDVVANYADRDPPGRGIRALLP